MKQFKFMWLLIVLLALAACGQQPLPDTFEATPTAAPTITSDKEDYAPGELVTLTGSNWQAGESVQIVVDDDGLDVENPWKRTVTVTADDVGNITDQFNLPNKFVADYVVTATGDTSGTATTSFTDANVEAKANLPGTATTKVKWVLYGTTDCTGTPKANSTLGGVTLTGSTATALTGASKVQSLKLTADASSSDNKAFDKWTDKDGTTLAKLDIDATTTCQTNFNNGEGVVTFTANYAAAPTPTTRTTTTTLARTAGANPSTYGDSVTFTATVTATDGNPNGVGTVTFKNGSTVLCNAVALSGNTATCSPSLNAGSYSITVEYSGTTSGSPTFGGSTSTALSHTINPKQLTGSFTSNNKEYDGNASATVTGRSLSGVLASDEDKVSLSGGTASFNNASVANGKTVTLAGASLAGDAATNYSLSSVSTATANITTKSVTGSFTAENKIYDGDPSATVTRRSLSGVLAADESKVSLFEGTARFDNASAGTDKIVTLTGARLTGDASGNYSLSSVSTTTASITPKSLTGSFTAEDKVYDGNADATVADYNLNGVINGDVVALRIEGAQFDDKNVGNDKTVTVNTSDLEGTHASNYTLAGRVWTTSADITPRPITVTAVAKSKVYGDNDPTFTYSVTNGSLVNGESFSGALSRRAGENVGTYAIQLGNLSAGDNYELSFTGADLTITKRAITVTADAKTRQYGDTDPALTHQVTNGLLRQGDSLSGALTRDAGEAVGEYNIKQGTLDAGSNYDLTFVGNKLTVTKRAITVTADAKSKQYGDADPALTYSITSGSLLNGDSLSGVLSRAAGDNVGTHAIQQNTLSANGNYELTFVGVNLTITQRPITVTADAKSKFFGDADPALTYSVTSGSLVNSDSFSGTLSRAAGENVGSYAIQQGTLSAGGNYNLSFVRANLTISAWTLRGFYAPVDMGGTLNNAKAGSTVPLKFEVFAGSTELTSTSVISTFTQKTSCTASTTGDDIEQYATGGTSLRYDTTSGQFIFNWQTPKAAGNCYRVTMTTQDGSSISADFRLK